MKFCRNFGNFWLEIRKKNQYFLKWAHEKNVEIVDLVYLVFLLYFHITSIHFHFSFFIRVPFFSQSFSMQEDASRSRQGLSNSCAMFIESYRSMIFVLTFFHIVILSCPFFISIFNVEGSFIQPSIWLQKSTWMQPRTDRSKFAGENDCPGDEQSSSADE